MANWKNSIKIRDLITESEDWDTVKEEMAEMADRIEKSGLFPELDLTPFRNIPEGDGVITPVKYANILMERVYDYADEALIWIE